MIYWFLISSFISHFVERPALQVSPHIVPSFLKTVLFYITYFKFWRIWDRFHNWPEWTLEDWSPYPAHHFIKHKFCTENVTCNKSPYYLSRDNKVITLCYVISVTIKGLPQHISECLEMALIAIFAVFLNMRIAIKCFNTTERRFDISSRLLAVVSEFLEVFFQFGSYIYF